MTPIGSTRRESKVCRPIRSARSRGLILAAGLILWVGADTAWACAVCFGDPNSTMAQGAVRGVLFLAAVIGAVLVGIAGIATSWFVKARRLEREGGDSSV